MSTATAHYGFVKPDPSDFEDVSIIDQNMDSIDTALWINAQNETSNENAHTTNANNVASHGTRITNLEGKDTLTRKGVVTNRLNTSALAADPQLTFNAIASALYKVTFLLNFKSSTSSTVQIGFSLPTIARKSALTPDGTSDPNNNGWQLAVNPITSGAVAYTHVLETTYKVIPISVFLQTIAGQSGAFTLLWSGNNGANSIDLDAESYLLVERVI